MEEPHRESTVKVTAVCYFGLATFLLVLCWPATGRSGGAFSQITHSSRRLLLSNTTASAPAPAPEPEAFPLDPPLSGYTPIIDGVERVYGIQALSKVAALSAILDNVASAGLTTFGLTVGSGTPVLHPADTPGLEDFGGFDLPFTLYSTVGQPVQPFLNVETLSLGAAGAMSAIAKAGINATEVILWARQLANLATPAEDAVKARLLVTGENLIPFGHDKQTLLLDRLYAALNTLTPSIGSINVTYVADATPAHNYTSAGGRRLRAMNATQAVYVDVWTATAAQGALMPSVMYSKVLGAAFQGATARLGLEMNATFINATSYMINFSKSSVPTITHDPPLGTPLLNATDVLYPMAAAAPAAPVQNASAPVPIAAPVPHSSSSLSGGAIAGIVIGAVCVLLIVAGGLAALVWRKRPRAEKEPFGKNDSNASAGSTMSNIPILKHLISWRRSSSSGGSSGASTLKTQKSAGLSDSIPLPANSSGIAMEIDPAEITICLKEDGTPWLLGEGNFGQVFKGLRRGVQEVAVKKLTRTYDPTMLKQIKKEIGILKRVSFDKHIVQFYGACLADPAKAMLVMEYMGGGDLRQNLSMPNRQERLAWSQHGKTIAMGIAQGLHFLHSSGVIHRDIKTSNILLTKEGVAKIADVGLATIVTADYFSWETAMGTFAYAAPELLMGEQYTEKVDIYSLGVVFWEISTRDVPIRGKLRPLKAPEDCPEPVLQLISDCLSPNPTARPSADEIYHRIKDMNI